MEKAEDRATHQMTLRLPTALVEQLKEIAKRNKRSLRAEIELVLETYARSQHSEK